MTEAFPLPTSTEEPSQPQTLGELPLSALYDVSEDLNMTRLAVDRVGCEVQALVRAAAFAVVAGLLWYVYVERRRVF